VKYRVSNPIPAAAITGGCTFEPEIGWWTCSTQPIEGKNFEGNRDALYIPTLQKTGSRVSESAIENLKKQAQELGFNNLACARGMWILSTTGEPQIEVIWIAWTKSVTANVREQLPTLASHIKTICNQDAVAWEQNGELCFTGQEAA
jgi:hypothetical protein